jgi:hypothetical protein
VVPAVTVARRKAEQTGGDHPEQPARPLLIRFANSFSTLWMVAADNMDAAEKREGNRESARTDGQTPPNEAL